MGKVLKPWWCACIGPSKRDSLHLLDFGIVISNYAELMQFQPCLVMAKTALWYT